MRVEGREAGGAAIKALGCSAECRGFEYHPGQD